MDSAGSVSRIFFLWTQPILRSGYRQPLKGDQAPPLPQKLRSSLQERYKQTWAEECLLSKQSGKKPSLHRAFFKLVGSDFKLAFILQITSVLCKFANVVIVRRLAQIIASQGDEGQTEGLLLAGLIFVLNTLEGILETNATFNLQLALYAVQSCVSQSVLRKGMLLHPDAQKKFKRGDLVTLALSDFNRVIEFSHTIMLGFSSPVMLAMAFLIIAIFLGPSILVGVIVVGLAAFVITKIGKFQGGKFRGKMIAMGGRMSAINELLQSVRFTKFYGMEEHYQTQIVNARSKEERELATYRYAMCSSFPIATGVPVAIMGIIICLNLLIHGRLPDQADMFAALGATKILYFPTAFFGLFQGNLNMMYVSIARLQEVIMQPEVDGIPASALPSHAPVVKESETEKQYAVRITNQCFSWSANSDVPVTLRDIDLAVPQGEFWVVVGELGSGKSSLLMAILGRIDAIKSNNGINTRVDGCSRAYVAQEPMIMNASVKDNILFGLNPDNHEKMDHLYGKAVAAAALDTDLHLLPAGDATEIGEKGITLSGGQKARVALARAVLTSKAEGREGLVLLDDPLSAVDSQVGTHIFEKCLVEDLAGTTRILVTNQLHYLNHAAVSNIVVMSKGCIVEQGRFDTLTANPQSHFSQLLNSVHNTHGDEKKTGEGQKAEDKKTETVVPTTSKAVGSITGDKSGKLTEKEKKAEGAITWKNLTFYINLLGGWHIMIGIAFMSWVFHWTEMTPDMLLVLWQDDLLEKDDSWYLPIWLTTGVVGVLIAFGCRFAWVAVAVPAASTGHHMMLERVLHCPTSFFDKTPSGQIMNRFGEDVMQMDFTVPLMMEVIFLNGFKSLDQVIVALIARPLIAPFVLMLAILLWAMKEVHRRTIREVFRWWMVTKSPMFNIFEEVLSGTNTIFAFGREEYFLSRFEKALRSNLEWLMIRDSTNLWIDQRLFMIGAITTGVLAVQIVLFPDGASSAFTLVALIYALNLGLSLKLALFHAVQFEGSFASVERCADLCKVDQEPAWHLPADINLKTQNWPGSNCTLELMSVCIRYQPHLPRALDAVSASFAPREKVGIVGRTGSGKSTIMGTLFRLFDLEDGKVLLGGVDISTIGLKLLRQQFTIVPQDPVLFSGPVRKNLDPLSICSDQDIWTCLKRCFLTELIEGLDGGLTANVEPGGTNFSVGERQVLCLARALLRNSSILCLDEATANVDPVNDQKIQQILQTQMQEFLVLTIAHRLHTVMHSDRIMVLDRGKLAQLDSPAALLSSPGIFQDLAAAAGISLSSIKGA